MNRRIYWFYKILKSTFLQDGGVPHIFSIYKMSSLWKELDEATRICIKLKINLVFSAEESYMHVFNKNTRMKTIVISVKYVSVLAFLHELGHDFIWRTQPRIQMPTARRDRIREEVYFNGLPWKDVLYCEALAWKYARRVGKMYGIEWITNSEKYFNSYVKPLYEYAMESRPDMTLDITDEHSKLISKINGLTREQMNRLSHRGDVK